VDELVNKALVPMGPDDITRHQKLARDIYDGRIKPVWTDCQIG
jgi:hypothetical protein